jgi:hypothetical protein
MRLIQNKISKFQQHTQLPLPPKYVTDYAIKKCIKGKKEILPVKQIKSLFFQFKLMPKVLKRYFTLLNNKSLVKSQNIIKGPLIHPDLRIKML